MGIPLQPLPFWNEIEFPFCGSDWEFPEITFAISGCLIWKSYPDDRDDHVLVTPFRGRFLYDSWRKDNPEFTDVYGYIS